MPSHTKLIQYLKDHRVAKSSELNQFESNVGIKRLSDSGEITALGSGFYAHASVDPLKGSLAVVSKYYPKAVVSNLTALFIYDLTDERIDTVDVDIPASMSIRNKLLSTHRVEDRFITGVTEIQVEEYKVKIYTKERALCDVYRSRGRGAIFYKALKRYVKSSKKIDFEAIAAFDLLLGTKVLEAASQEVADE